MVSAVSTGVWVFFANAGGASEKAVETSGLNANFFLQLKAMEKVRLILEAQSWIFADETGLYFY